MEKGSPWLLSWFFYFCTELQIIFFMDRFKIHISRNFLEHILYAWFVYHCRGLHKLADLKVVMPFYVVVSNGASCPFDFVRAQKHLRNFRNFTICVNPPINNPDWVPKKADVVREPNVDFVIDYLTYVDKKRVWRILLTSPEQE